MYCMRCSKLGRCRSGDWGRLRSTSGDSMDIQLTFAEQRLLDHAKASVVKYNEQRHARGGIDTLYSFLITAEGALYDGAAFEPSIAHATVCGERHAIANLVL